MKISHSWPLGPLAFLLAVSAICFATSPSWGADPGNVLFGNDNVAPSSNFDGDDIFGSGAVGETDANGKPIGNLGNPGVLGESHPGWGANQVNGGNFIPGPINDYPNWSTVGRRYGGNGPNERHQFPIGVRGGVPETSTKLIAPMNNLMTGSAQGSGFEGQHTFGFSGDQSQEYLGVRSTAKGVSPQSGGSLQPTGTGAVNVNITDGW
ncbi:MAG: hypothetical protein C5B53_03340 [Candidatus Melainabacteria bacterium]|nr:MAG: hypothetical protein C5B53_03340 [Candidatus Melainabacteria bacterium]